MPLSTLVNSDIKPAPIVINHQGMFPSVTISFNLEPGVALGDAVAAIQQIEKQTGKPASLATSFQGNAQAFQSSLSGTPMLIGAALVVIYIILGVLYESAIHPITILSTLPSAGIGALLLLMAVHMDLSVIAMIGIILLIGIVKKNGIMLVDFALEVERTRRTGAGRVDLPRLHHAFPADPDDHHGGAAGRRAADAGHRRRDRRSASRSATRSSAACCCPSFSRCTRRRSSTSISTGSPGGRGARGRARAHCGGHPTTSRRSDGTAAADRQLLRASPMTRPALAGRGKVWWACHSASSRSATGAGQGAERRVA